MSHIGAATLVSTRSTVPVYSSHNSISPIYQTYNMRVPYRYITL